MFLTGAGVAAVGVAGGVPLARWALREGSVPSPPLPVAEDYWMGPAYWPNRTQDWARLDGRITCIAPAGHRQLCTNAVLTHALTGRPVQLQVTLEIAVEGAGFAGLCLGTGGPDADHRRAALVGTASGTGGGLLAVFDVEGSVAFRDHSDERAQEKYALLPTAQAAAGPAWIPGQRVTLVLDVEAGQGNGLTLRLRAEDEAGSPRSTATLTGVRAAEITGGLALVSAGAGSAEATFRFGELTATGPGVEVDDGRGLGPIVGTLFTLSGGVLKMTAQLTPGLQDPQARVRLQTRDGRGWTDRATGRIGPGYAVALRVEGWDCGRDTEYRVLYGSGRDTGSWGGTVPAEPGTDRPLRIATVSCSKASHRVTDRSSDLQQGLPGDHPLGLYTDANVYFPYESTVASIQAQEPDLLVAMGDQFYETAPTGKDDDAAPTLDFLYRYLQWLWAFRELTKDVPTVVLIDDHDVYQGNLWGRDGQAVPAGEATAVGGYVNAPGWINLVQAVQCGHNPDPVDPDPVQQGIGVYFTRFDYGGVTFAVLEDRKFKTGPDSAQGRDDATAVLLGERQERMLAGLGDAAGPVVVLTQTMYAGVETDAAGAVTGTKDSDGWPAVGRDRALRLIKQASAVMLSGDTHLAALVRHRVDGRDGPIQFCGPAVGTSYARWFQPVERLPDAGRHPFTGRATDTFGNTFVVLAVANPLITQAELRGAIDDRGIGDRRLKREGYGMCIVDHVAEVFRFEAWAWDSDPGRTGDRPMAGWPFSLPFARA